MKLGSRPAVVGSICLALSLGATADDTQPSPAGRDPVPAVRDRFTPSSPSAVQFHGLLGRYVDAVRENFILRSNIVSTYLAPLEERSDKTWKSEHIGKWLEAACASELYHPDPRVGKLIDEALSRILAVQLPNGWLGGYAESSRFYDVDWNSRPGPGSLDEKRPGWDLWCNFTALEGLLHYHWAFPGETNALAAALRLGDLIVQTFGEGKQDIALVPHDYGIGSMCVMLGVGQLYEVTGQPRYLEFCRYVVRQFGRTNSTPFILASSRGPDADRWPYSAQGAVVKHTESELILCGLCEMYRMTGEEQFLATCKNVYDAAYAPLIETLCLAGYDRPETGKPRPRTVRERVETDDVVAMSRWWAEMFRLTGEPRYLNALEREVYDQLLCFRTPEGRAFSYMPAKHLICPSGCIRRYTDMDVFNCCWSMGPLGFTDLPRWCYFTSPNGILVNFFEPSTYQGRVLDVPVSLVLSSGYPIDGRIEIAVKPERPVLFALQLRIPPWAGAASVEVNGQGWKEQPVRGTILSLRREWQPGDRVVLELPMTPRVVRPDGLAPGFYLLERGPLVLAMSRRFNPIGEGWCYVAPGLDGKNSPNLERVSVTDPAGQATVGWRIPGVSRLHTGRRMLEASTVATLVPFYDAGAERDPYVVAFPEAKTLDLLPPRLGPESEVNLASVMAGAKARADSDSKEHESCGTYAIDGDPLTSWYSATNDCPHWLEVKLPQPKRIRRLVLKFGDRDNYPMEFKLVVGLGAQPPREILSVKNSNLADYFWAEIAPFRADKLRLIVEKSSDEPPSGACISELELYEH